MRQIGLVEELRFHLYKGKSFSFDVLWWTDAAKTQAAVITSVRGKIKKQNIDGAVLIVDLAPTFLVNRTLVRLTPAQTLALVEGLGYLELEATTAVETKVLSRGPVVIHPEVSE